MKCQTCNKKSNVTNLYPINDEELELVIQSVLTWNASCIDVELDEYVQSELRKHRELK